MQETHAQHLESNILGKTESGIRRLIDGAFDEMRIDILAIGEEHHLQVVGTEAVPERIQQAFCAPEQFDARWITFPIECEAQLIGFLELQPQRTATPSKNQSRFYT